MNTRFALGKSKEIYALFFPLHNLPRIINYFDHKIKLQFNNSILVEEKNKYVTKIVNAHIVYDLDYCPKNPPDNFSLKSYLFGANNTVINSEKSKYVYSGYETAFDGAVLQSFGNDFARNVVLLKI